MVSVYPCVIDLVRLVKKEKKMPPKKSNKKKAPKKRPQKPKEKPTPAAEVEIPLENVGEKPIVDLAELNGSLSEKSRELVEIVEIEGKGRGMVARKDIEQERRFLVSKFI